VKDVPGRAINVTIVRWYENYPPGIIECQFSDRFGKSWHLAVKFYDATDKELYPESEYPLPGAILCKVLSGSRLEDGRATAVIELEIPFQNLTHEGVDCFEVFAEQLN
jgi:hypothetical protein